jgi:hypothetical protein
MRKILSAPILIAVLVCLVSCSHNIREELDKTVEKYNDLIRWNEMGAASAFTPERLREDFISRAESLKNVKIIDYKIIGVRYDEKLNKARVDVMIQYYVLTNFRAKKILYTEEWAYIEEQGVKGWKQMSPMPEFREN